MQRAQKGIGLVGEPPVVARPMRLLTAAAITKEKIYARRENFAL
jgi:hypothetical protein